MEFFWAVESVAFQRLSAPPIPQLLHLPIVLDRLDLSSVPQPPLKTQVAHMGPHSLPAASENEDLAIIPYMPSLHAVLIQLWAFAQSLPDLENLGSSAHNMDATQLTSFSSEAGSSSGLNMDLDVATALLDDSDSLVKAKKCLSSLMDAVVTTAGPSLPPSLARKVCLPTVVSRAKSNKPLSSVNIRRSPRLNNSQDGFQHTQLEGTPRKRRRQQVTPAGAGDILPKLSLDDPPKPTDELMPAPVPLDILQSWGLQCGVPPSEVAPEALLADKSDDGNQDA